MRNTRSSRLAALFDRSPRSLEIFAAIIAISLLLWIGLPYIMPSFDAARPKVDLQTTTGSMSSSDQTLAETAVQGADALTDHLVSALVHHQQYNYEAAIIDYTHAIALAPDAPGLYEWRGALYYAQAQYDLALADYNQLLILDPQNQYGYRSRAYAYRALGKYELALADNQRVIALDPTEARDYYDRAMVHIALDTWATVETDLKTALQLSTDTPEGYYLRGLIYRYQDKYNDSRRQFTLALANPPEDVGIYGVYYERAVTSYQAEEYESAIADFSTIIENVPDHVFAHRGLCDTRFAQEAWDYAIKDCTRAVELSPTNHNAYYTRAYTYLALAQPGKAKADFERVIELAPDSEEAADAKYEIEHLFDIE